MLLLHEQTLHEKLNSTAMQEQRYLASRRLLGVVQLHRSALW